MQHHPGHILYGHPLHQGHIQAVLHEQYSDGENISPPTVCAYNLTLQLSVLKESALAYHNGVRLTGSHFGTVTHGPLSRAVQVHQLCSAVVLSKPWCTIKNIFAETADTKEGTY